MTSAQTLPLTGPDVTEDALARVIAAAESGEWGKARGLLQGLLPDCPRRHDLHHLMGLLCLQNGDISSAIQAYEQAIALEPDVALYRHDLASVLFQARRWQAASDAYSKARQLDPLAFDCAAAIIQCQYELHCESALQCRERWELGAALQHAQTAAVLKPELSWGHSILGAIEFELGEYGRSAEAHASAVQRSMGAPCPSTYLGAQANARRLQPGSWQTTLVGTPEGLAQRDFGQLNQHMMDKAHLPDGSLFRRHPLAEPMTEPGDWASDPFIQGLHAAHRGDLERARAAFREWLESPSIRTWDLLHDPASRLYFRRRTEDDTGGLSKAGLLLEITLKCAHDPTRSSAGLALFDRFRESGLLPQAHCICTLLEMNTDLALHRPQWKAQAGANRIRCVVFGTCITRGLIYLLNLSEPFRRAFAIEPYITHMNRPLMSDFAVPDDVVESCQLLLHMPMAWADWGNDGYYETLLERFGSGVPRITFPYPVFHALWPYHCYDKRNKDPSLRNAQGDQAFYPYGDSYVLGLMRKHPTESAAQITERYAAVDIPACFDLDGLMRHSLQQQRAKERVTDVKVMDHFEENFSRQRFFLTMNHVGNAGLIYMANQVLRLLDLPALPEKTADQVQELTTPQVPIHPAILKYYGISYLHSGSRYLIDAHRTLTFDEYTEQYVLFQ